MYFIGKDVVAALLGKATLRLCVSVDGLSCLLADLGYSLQLAVGFMLVFDFRGLVFDEVAHRLEAVGQVVFGTHHTFFIGLLG